MNRHHVQTSKFLSLILRHNPEKIGLVLDTEGWASVPELLRLANAAGHPLSQELLLDVVERNDKQRFAMSADGKRIRANQGHSVQADLGLAPTEPPEHLYHGTAERNLASIRRTGLVSGSRNHVHLSPDEATATKVGQRHGRPVVLIVDATSMHRSGHTFYLSANGVWLVDRVPPEYLSGFS